MPSEDGGATLRVSPVPGRMMLRNGWATHGRLSAACPTKLPEVGYIVYGFYVLTRPRQGSRSRPASLRAPCRPHLAAPCPGWPVRRSGAAEGESPSGQGAVSDTVPRGGASVAVSPGRLGVGMQDRDVEQCATGRRRAGRVRGALPVDREGDEVRTGDALDMSHRPGEMYAVAARMGAVARQQAGAGAEAGTRAPRARQSPRSGPPWPPRRRRGRGRLPPSPARRCRRPVPSWRGIRARQPASSLPVDRCKDGAP